MAQGVRMRMQQKTLLVLPMQAVGAELLATHTCLLLQLSSRAHRVALVAAWRAAAESSRREAGLFGNLSGFALMKKMTDITVQETSGGSTHQECGRGTMWLSSAAQPRQELCRHYSAGFAIVRASIMSPVGRICCQ